MTTPTVTETRRAGQTNERVELARYRIGAGARVIYGQRVCGVVRLVDSPADERGRRYVIERELTVMAELEAIVRDYLEQAATWNVIPAAGRARCWPRPGKRSDDRPPAPRRDASGRTDRAGILRSSPSSAATSSVASTTRRRACMTCSPRPRSSARPPLRTVLACYEAMRAYDAAS